MVVQCSAGPQLQTLPTATPAAADSIKAFADSITRKSVSGKIVNAYRRISGSASSPSEVDARTLKQWRNQTAMMWVWLMSSLMVVVFVPTFVAPGALLLASLTASALGVIAVLMHCMGDRLAESGEALKCLLLSSDNACTLSQLGRHSPQPLDLNPRSP